MSKFYEYTTVREQVEGIVDDIDDPKEIRAKIRELFKGLMPQPRGGVSNAHFAVMQAIANNGHKLTHKYWDEEENESTDESYKQTMETQAYLKKLIEVALFEATLDGIELGMDAALRKGGPKRRYDKDAMFRALDGGADTSALVARFRCSPSLAKKVQKEWSERER